MNELNLKESWNNFLPPTNIQHSPTLLILKSVQINPVMTAFIHKLITNFDQIHIPTKVMLFAKDPFTVDAEGTFVVKAKHVLIQCSHTLLKTSNSRTFQRLSRPNSLDFKDSTQHSLKYRSRTIPSNPITFSRQVALETRMHRWQKTHADSRT